MPLDEKSAEQIDRNFAHHPPQDGETVERHENTRAILRHAASTICGLLPDGAGREQAMFLTKMEEAMMAANAGIARHS